MVMTYTGESYAYFINTSLKYSYQCKEINFQSMNINYYLNFNYKSYLLYRREEENRPVSTILLKKRTTLTEKNPTPELNNSFLVR